MCSLLLETVEDGDEYQLTGFPFDKTAPIHRRRELKIASRHQFFGNASEIGSFCRTRGHARCSHDPDWSLHSSDPWHCITCL